MRVQIPIFHRKYKVKRLALVSDVEDGGLKAPHLDAIIRTQRILVCKRLANEQTSNWKTILRHYLKPVVGLFILCCDFDVETLPITLPPFYEECLKYFSECSVSNKHLISENNELITKHKLRELNISPLDSFRVTCVIEVIPTEW